MDPSTHFGKCPQDSASWVDTPSALPQDGWNEQARLSEEPIRARGIQTAETTVPAPAAERQSFQSRTRERPRPRPRIFNKRLPPSSLPTSSAMERRQSAQGFAESRGDVDELTLPAMHGPSSASGVAQEHVGSPRETGGKTGVAKRPLKAEVAVLGSIVPFEGYLSTAEIYSRVRSLCQEAGVISPSTSIRLHRPGAPEDWLPSLSADMMTQAFLEGAQGLWHVSKREEDGSLLSLAAPGRPTRHIRSSGKEPVQEHGGSPRETGGKELD